MSGWRDAAGYLLFWGSNSGGGGLPAAFAPFQDHLVGPCAIPEAGLAFLLLQGSDSVFRLRIGSSLVQLQPLGKAGFEAKMNCLVVVFGNKLNAHVSLFSNERLAVDVSH